MKIYRLVISLCLLLRVMWSVYLLVGFQLSSGLCHLSSDVHFSAFVEFDLLLFVLHWRAWGYPSVSGSSHEKPFCLWRILLEEPPEREDICDDLLRFATTPSKFWNFNFADEIFFLEGKNYNALQIGLTSFFTILLYPKLNK